MKKVDCHTILACYFASKPHFFDGDSQKKPNIRKCSEQPWQQLTSKQWEDSVEQSLTNFTFVFTKVRAGLLEGLFEDFLFADRVVPAEYRKQLDHWIAFFSEKIHILRRGKDRWPAYRIFFQLAVEHADDSPLTKSAETWLFSGNCNWHWLRQTDRRPRMELNPCIAVFEGHTDKISGALETRDGNILSWSTEFRAYDDNKNTIRLWDKSGKLLAKFEGHDEAIDGAIDTSEGNILSWSKEDGTIILWDIRGKKITSVNDRLYSIIEIIETGKGNILTWSNYNITLRDRRCNIIASLEGSVRKFSDGVLITCQGNISAMLNEATVYWEDNGKTIAFFEDSLARTTYIRKGDLLTWIENRLWDRKNNKTIMIAPQGYSSGVRLKGALVSGDGNVLTWLVGSAKLMLLDKEGKIITMQEGHKDIINGILETRDGNMLTWSKDRTLRLWNANGKTIALFEGHISEVVDAIETLEGYFISEGAPAYGLKRGIKMMYRQVIVWDSRGKQITEFEKYPGSINKIREPVEGRFLMGLKLLDLKGIQKGVFKGHTARVSGIYVTSENNVLTWSEDRTLRLWDIAIDPVTELKDGDVRQISNQEKKESGSLSWSDDTIWLKNKEGNTIREFVVRYDTWDYDEHRRKIAGATETRDGNILSWSLDGTVRLWDKEGKLLNLADEYIEAGITRLFETSNGNFLSWSTDEVYDYPALHLRVKTGNTIKKLFRHKAYIKEAIESLDGNFLSLSGDNTVRLWSGDGRHLNVFSLQEAMQLLQDWLVENKVTFEDFNIFQYAIGFRFVTFPIHKSHPEETAVWHSDAKCNIRHINNDGKILVKPDGGQDIILQLYKGERPVTFDWWNFHKDAETNK